MKFISVRDISSKLSEIIHETMMTPHPFIKGKRDDPAPEKNVQDVEILGPYITRTRQGKSEVRLLLKSSVRGKLHATARTFVETFKESRDVRIKIDVDPIAI